MAEADAALKLGLTAPQIEQRLVAKGLSPSMASAVVMGVLEGRLRAAEPSAGSEKSRTAHGIASILVGLLCLMLAYGFGGGLSVAKTFLGMMLPLATIWWPEVMDSYLPPAILRWVAWLALLTIVVYRVVLLTLQ